MTQLPDEKMMIEKSFHVNKCDKCGAKIMREFGDQMGPTVDTCRDCKKEFCRKCTTPMSGTFAPSNMTPHFDQWDRDYLLCPSCEKVRQADERQEEINKAKFLLRSEGLLSDEELPPAPYFSGKGSFP